MDRQSFYEMMDNSKTLDYGKYLNTDKLLQCQKAYDQLCNHDELQFQIVHQVEELWMKLVAYTLLDIDEYLEQKNTNRVLTLFARVHCVQRLMIEQLKLLETMSPKEYQEIRLQLGNGSGQESPGFRTLLQMPKFLWQSFLKHYLDDDVANVTNIYHHAYQHDDAYMVAEAMIEFDELFQAFRYHHIQLIHRSIGISVKSLKGRSVELLERGLKQRFFPALWDIRHQMTEQWGNTYGTVRESIEPTPE